MNKNKVSATIHLVSAVCWFITSAINFKRDNAQKGIIHLCLGTMLFCLSTVYLNKYQNENPEESEQDKLEA